MPDSHGVIAAFDVAYRKDFSQTACILFDDWAAAREQDLIIETLPVEAGKYVSGEFYRRELPCLLNLISRHEIKPRLILIDGYVWLGEYGKPGLGARFYSALSESVPVIGIAKSPRRGDEYAKPIIRGTSQSPLYITGIGIDPSEAARHILSMHGDHRMPTLLKRVDRATRRSL